MFFNGGVVHEVFLNELFLNELSLDEVFLDEVFFNEMFLNIVFLTQVVLNEVFRDGACRLEVIISYLSREVFQGIDTAVSSSYVAFFCISFRQSLMSCEKRNSMKYQVHEKIHGVYGRRCFQRCSSFLLDVVFDIPPRPL